MSETRLSAKVAPSRPRFFARPSTALGRASAILFAGAVALVALMATLAEVMARRQSARPPTAIGLGAGIALCLLGAAITGLVALIARRERSWVVFVSTAVPLLLLGNELAQGLLSLN